MRIRVRAVVLCLVGALPQACGSSPPPRFSPGQPSPEQEAQFKEALAAYLRNDPEFDGLRDMAAADPVVSYRLTQALVTELARALQRRSGSVEQHFLLAAAGKRDPYEERSLEHLRAMGPPAVMPFVREELLKPARGGEGRFLGLTIIEALGSDAVAELEPLLQSTEERDRRVGVQALGAVSVDDPQLASLVDGALERALGDPEFTVRAMAAETLAGHPGADAILRRVMLSDADPFVRRKAAEGLGAMPSVENATLLVDYLELCQESGDHAGAEAVQDALQSLAGRRGVRSLSAWRRWLMTYDGR